MTAEEHRPHHGARYAFIPAGALIGLGTGLLAGFPGSGVLIGLGLGFLATALLPLKSPENPESLRMVPWGRAPVMLVLGVFMIVIGLGIVIAPKEFWVYIVPAFLILLGIGFIFRGARAGS